MTQGTGNVVARNVEEEVRSRRFRARDKLMTGACKTPVTYYSVRGAAERNE